MLWNRVYMNLVSENDSGKLVLSLYLGKSELLKS